jgi:hypothetical protein
VAESGQFLKTKAAKIGSLGLPACRAVQKRKISPVGCTRREANGWRFPKILVRRTGPLPRSRLLAAITPGLPLISELSRGCFQVKSAPQFSWSGYHDRDAQKIQALAVKKRCRRNASLLRCDRKPSRRLAVESSPANPHTPTLHGPLRVPPTAKLRSSFPRADRAFKL